MPTLENYAYADTPHEKTVQRDGYRYGCHSTTRGGRHTYLATPWIWEGPVAVETDWLPIPCGHTTRATDPACEGCRNRD